MSSPNRKTNLLIFSFWIPHGVITQVLFGYKDKCKILFASGENGLQKLINLIEKDSPRYILGLGYYRKGIKQIRSEQVFTNRYGKNLIDKEGKYFYHSNWRLPNTLPAFKAGVSNCNRFSYVVLGKIDKLKLGTKYAFLHVAPDYARHELSKVIATAISASRI